MTLLKIIIIILINIIYFLYMISVLWSTLEHLKLNGFPIPFIGSVSENLSNDLLPWKRIFYFIFFTIIYYLLCKYLF